VLQAAAGSGVPALVVAGSVAAEMAALVAGSVPGTGLHSLTELAGSTHAAQHDPVRWLTVAGRMAAAAAGRR
jgi:hypothetical protein